MGSPTGDCWGARKDVPWADPESAHLSVGESAQESEIGLGIEQAVESKPPVGVVEWAVLCWEN